MSEESYVVLEEGIETRLEFDTYAWVRMEIRDPDLNKLKKVKALKFGVKRIDGERVSTTFSILAKGLMGEMEPYLVDSKYLDYEFTYLKDRRKGVGAKLISTKRI